MSPRWGSTPRLTDWLIVSRNVTSTSTGLVADIKREILVWFGHAIEQIKQGSVITLLKLKKKTD
jgi:hypothetical protein